MNLRPQLVARRNQKRFYEEGTHLDIETTVEKEWNDKEREQVVPSRYGLSEVRLPSIWDFQKLEDLKDTSNSSKMLLLST